ncbi:hypothetical protein TS71_21790 [Mycolicibacterium neoaurum]|nr:hypothetical protein MyAD_19475 [Mycolicibacterium neoaurum]KJQ48337.1 hypothetical protein TS71_21790 [Mycolicibacterium neoaurum]
MAGGRPWRRRSRGSGRFGGRTGGAGDVWPGIRSGAGRIGTRAKTYRSVIISSKLRKLPRLRHRTLWVRVSFLGGGRHRAERRRRPRNS